jgi:hypothetical protein
MQQPSCEVDKNFEEALQGLPPESMQMAREFKAFCRARQIRSPLELMRAVLQYCGVDKTLREVAANLTLLKRRLTDTAVQKRLMAAQPWVEVLLQRMVGVESLGLGELRQRFVLVDGSCIEGPGARGTDYLVHISMDLLSLKFLEIWVTDKSRGETLKNFSFEPGDLVVGDRLYCAPAEVFWAIDQGAEVLLRYRLNVPLYRPKDGALLNLPLLLTGQKRGTLRSLPVLMRSASDSEEPREVLGYLHAYRMTEQEAQRAQKRFHRYWQKKGTRKKPSEKACFFADWILLFTTLSSEELSAEQALALFRFRWQVELAIKRWKSLLDLDALRSKRGGKLAKLWLHGKLLYALLLERRFRATFGDHWGLLDQPRQGSWWRGFKLMRDALDPLITQASFWRPEAVADALKVLLERPRRRKLQALPSKLLDLSDLLRAEPQDRESLAA